MNKQSKIIKLYEEDQTKFIFDINDLKNNNNLKIDYINDINNHFLQLSCEDVLYSYVNIKGFKKLNIKQFNKFYINDNENERLKLSRILKDEYSHKKVLKCLLNGELLYKEINEDLNFDFKECDKYTLWHIYEKKEIVEINNYQKLKEKIEEIKITERKPSLLIHSCCGPCSSHVLNFLNEYFKITVYYSNSNIDCLEEFNKRVEEQQKIINIINKNINLVIDPYESKDFYLAIKGFENLKEFSMRCYQCYRFRLERVCKYAKKNKFDYYTTTLSISPYKNSDWINELGNTLSKENNIKFLYSNFKLEDGYKKSIELSKKYKLYRQDYCGCIYSKLEQKKKSH